MLRDHGLAFWPLLATMDWLGWGDLTPGEQEAVKTYVALGVSLALNCWLVLVAMFRPGAKRKKHKKRRR